MEDNYNGFVNGLHELKQFLDSAPSQFKDGELIHRHRLPNSEVIFCVRWENVFYVPAQTILRCLIYRIQAFGREVLNRAKFEEFVFSDLRSLKTNIAAKLEEGRSELLEFLHRHGCVRTKKKQRVFYWHAVPHDRLFLDTLERELRRTIIDDANNETHRITLAVREPALSFRFNPLLKVASQIPDILKNVPSEYFELICAVFGVNEDTAFAQYRRPSGTSFTTNHATLPPPKQPQAGPVQKVRLPPITDVLPAHAHIDLEIPDKQYPNIEPSVDGGE